MPVDKAAALAAKAKMLHAHAEILQAQAAKAQILANKAAAIAQKKALFLAAHGAGPQATAYAKSVGTLAKLSAPAMKTTAAALKPVIVFGKIAVGVGGSILAGIFFNGL